MTLQLVPRTESGHVDPNAARSAPRKTRVDRHITPEEFEQIRKAARARSRNPLRDALLVTLCYRHGLRISEAVALSWDDLQLGRAGTIYIRRSKGSRDGTHNLDTDELRMLRDMQRHQREKGHASRFVFVSERGGPLTDRQARRAITAAGKAAGARFTNPHALRHGAGYRLARKGTDIRRIQEFLGHVNIQNTEHYTALDPSAIAGLERD